MALTKESLQTEIERLKKKTAALENLVALIEDPDAAALLQGFNGSAPAAAPKPEPLYRQPRQIQNRGQQKALVLALHTGPASESDLRRALVWEPRVLRSVLSTTLRHGLVASSSDGKLYCLTATGIQHAKFFIAHPESMNYQPWRFDDSRRVG